MNADDARAMASDSAIPAAGRTVQDGTSVPASPQTPPAATAASHRRRFTRPATMATASGQTTPGV